MKEPIKIWTFYDAPQELQDLSTNGGDEDWIAVVPDYLKEVWIPWMEEGSTFGCYRVYEYDHPLHIDYKVRIGCHS